MYYLRSRVVYLASNTRMNDATEGSEEVLYPDTIPRILRVPWIQYRIQ